MPRFGFLKLSVSPWVEAIRGGKAMLLLLDLIGFGVIVAAVTFGIWSRQFLDEMKQMDE